MKHDYGNVAQIGNALFFMALLSNFKGLQLKKNSLAP